MKKKSGVFIGLIIGVIILAFLALMIGRMNLTPVEVIRALVGMETSDVSRITVLTFRLPRIILALLVGAGLSVSGLAYQALFANPLATPDTLGVASGASFGAALGIILSFSSIGIGLMAFAFGLIAVGITYLAGRGNGRGMLGMILAGIMIGSLFSALVSFIKYISDTETKLPAITFFLMGSLASASIKECIIGGSVILVGMIVIFALRWRLNLLPLSEDEIRSSGVNAKKLRIVTVLAATVITGSCVAMCGQVGWVGLLVPHLCRLLVGENYKYLVPTSILLGGGFLVIVDTVARSVTASEIPISILTAIIGAPLFIYLSRRYRWS